MSNNLYGTGTKFYGREETRPDGSFMATKWIVLIYIPIIPLGYFYVRPMYETVGTISRCLPPATKRMGWHKRHIINVYASMLAIAIALLTLHHRINTPTTAAAIPARMGKGKALPPDRTNPDYTRPTHAENGSPFPETSGYIEGYEQKFSEGYAQLTVNNTQNTSDIYVKLYLLNEDAITPARVFLVEAEDSFTVSELTEGGYELRYRDLDTGGLAKTEPLPLEKNKEDDGYDYYDHMEVTLSKVVNGNLETEPISEEAF